MNSPYSSLQFQNASQPNPFSKYVNICNVISSHHISDLDIHLATFKFVINWEYEGDILITNDINNPIIMGIDVLSVSGFDGNMGGNYT